MLKSILVLIALLSIHIGVANAQTLSVGPMIGVNASRFTGQPNTKSIAGLAIGAFGNYSVNEHIGIGAKLLYSQLGSGFNDTDHLNRLHYIQLPITGIYYFGESGDKLRPKIYAGPYVGRLLKTTVKDGTKITTIDGEPFHEKLDVGGVIGVGFNYRIKSRTWLNADLGFSQGFININKTPGVVYKNQSFGLNVGVSFPVGKG
ncbi:porin family protein [Lacihabitans lacunae]|uniref:Porin family protein n=1 Tax=Lacihabitans lacunae TaxID=1028214 RepID=A0ABV7Z255_9BACT